MIKTVIMKPHRIKGAINCHRFGFFQMAVCALINEPLYSRKYNMARNIAAKKTTPLAKTTRSCLGMLLPFPLPHYDPTRPNNSSRAHAWHAWPSPEARSVRKLTHYPKVVSDSLTN